MSRALTPLARRLADEHAQIASRRDQHLVDVFLSVLDRLVWLYSPEVRNVENLPRSGPVLVVANHSCIVYMPDAAVVARAVARRRGTHSPTYGLAYDLLFAVPWMGPVIRRLGLLPAGEDAAREAFDEGAAVLVFPGGDIDACRPWSERDVVEFGGHRGFIRLALRSGVPVVPVVAHGAHHGMVVLARGDRVANALGLGSVRVHVLPIVLGPLGAIPIIGPPPMPTHITVEFLPPTDWSEHSPEAADDPAVVEQCYAEVVGAMQATLDRLAAECPHPVTEGWRRLVLTGVNRAGHHSTRESAPVSRS